MAALRIHAYAKLNLGLRVVGRRADGYHLLQSTMAAVDFADTLSLSLEGKGVQVRCRPSVGITSESNLVTRAISSALSRTGIEAGVRVSVRKRIPPGAGLGGGSADAAAALVGVNYLLALGLTDDELHALARALGADVPFFLGPSPAWAEGVGDRLRASPAQLPGAFLLLLPPRGCPTSLVYRLYDELGIPLSHPSTAPEQLDFRNDLYPAALAVYPELAAYRRLLDQPGTLGTGLTGSGSCLFAAYRQRAAAEAARDHLQGRIDARLLVAAPTSHGYNIVG